MEFHGMKTMKEKASSFFTAHLYTICSFPVAYCHFSVIILLQPTFKSVAYHCTNYKTEGFIPLFRNDNLCMLHRNVYYLCLFSNSQHILAVYSVLFSNLQLVFCNNVYVIELDQQSRQGQHMSHFLEY